MQVAQLVGEAEQVDQIRQELVEENREVAGHESRESFTISKATLHRRKSAPTGESTCSVSSLRQRRQETLRQLAIFMGGAW